MAKKVLSLVFAGILVSFFTLAAPGCAKKPKAPEVEETVSKVDSEAEAKAKEKADASKTKEAPYEGFKPLKEPTSRSTDVPANVQLEDIMFDFDRYDLREDQKNRLEAAANALKENIELGVVLEGHCDERGTNAYNRALGEKRATAVADFLASLGIKRSALNKISYGEEKPVCTEREESCWKQNRRVHFLLSIKQ